MYTLSGYGSMIDDRVRVDAYSGALRQVVRPGSVVLEIGTGPGTFAVLACQLGAGRVYAVEPDSIIQVGREIAAANGYADRIEFIEDLSTRITLPERADVIISDLRGVLPLFETHVPSIIDARCRFLAPGGALIPKKDALWVSVVEGPEQYSSIVNSWDHNLFQQNLNPARRLAVNDFIKTNFKPEQMLAPPQLWATLDYHTIECPDVRGTMKFSAQRAGTGHGLAVWFDTCLADGIGFSNAPGAVETVYGSAFFPWCEPVSVSEGQEICVDLEATLRADQYVWRWSTHFGAAPGMAARRLEQSQLSGAVLSLPKIRRAASDFVPQLSDEGLVNRRALELMDGRNSLEEIARQLADEFPQSFDRWQQALSYAAKRSQQFSR